MASRKLTEEEQLRNELAQAQGDAQKQKEDYANLQSLLEEQLAELQSQEQRIAALSKELETAEIQTAEAKEDALGIEGVRLDLSEAQKAMGLLQADLKKVRAELNRKGELAEERGATLEAQNLELIKLYDDLERVEATSKATIKGLHAKLQQTLRNITGFSNPFYDVLTPSAAAPGISNRLLRNPQYQRLAPSDDAEQYGTVRPFSGLAAGRHVIEDVPLDHTLVPIEELQKLARFVNDRVLAPNGDERIDTDFLKINSDTLKAAVDAIEQYLSDATIYFDALSYI